MIVVDTNILAYLCLPGPHATAAEQLLHHDPVWAAPLLWRSELRNILAGYMRRGNLNSSSADSIMTVAEESLLGGEHAIASDAVFRLVEQSNCTAYDCEFVALANALSCSLWTEDKALLSAFPSTCRSLKSLPN